MRTMENGGGKGDKPRGSGKQFKYKGPNSSKTQSTQKDKERRKAAANLEYDDTQFNKKIRRKKITIEYG